MKFYMSINEFINEVLYMFEAISVNAFEWECNLYDMFARASAEVVAKASGNRCHLEPSSSGFEGNSFSSRGAPFLLI